MPTETLTQKLRPLPGSPSAAHLADFAERLAESVPDQEATFGWLKETLLALPLPTLGDKPNKMDLLERHAFLTFRITKLRRMASWLVQDVRDCGYWKYPEVRAAFAMTLEGVQSLLAALEAESVRDAGAMTANEEAAVNFYYADAKESFLNA